MNNIEKYTAKTWKSLNDENISCTEKIKILNENIIEINQIIEDALEDAVLMGADPKQVIKVILKSLEEKILIISPNKVNNLIKYLIFCFFITLKLVLMIYKTLKIIDKVSSKYYVIEVIEKIVL